MNYTSEKDRVRLSLGKALLRIVKETYKSMIFADRLIFNCFFLLKFDSKPSSCIFMKASRD